jgi:hypothetical protein
MRVKQMVNKNECLKCLFTEINILTECRHPNVVKILDASFDGTLIKEEQMTLISSKKSKGPKKNLSDRSHQTKEESEVMDLTSPIDQMKASSGVSDSKGKSKNKED